MRNCSCDEGLASEENCELLEDFLQEQMQVVVMETPWESLIGKKAVVVQVLVGRV